MHWEICWFHDSFVEFNTYKKIFEDLFTLNQHFTIPKMYITIISFLCVVDLGTIIWTLFNIPNKWSWWWSTLNLNLIIGLERLPQKIINCIIQTIQIHGITKRIRGILIYKKFKKIWNRENVLVDDPRISRWYWAKIIWTWKKFWFFNLRSNESCYTSSLFK